MKEYRAVRYGKDAHFVTPPCHSRENAEYKACELGWIDDDYVVEERDVSEWRKSAAPEPRRQEEA